MRTSPALTPNKYLVASEQSALTETLRRYRFANLRDTTMLMLSLKSGARPSEVLNLTWDDIDWLSKSVFIRTLKGGPPRSVPLGSELINRLHALKPSQGLIFPITHRQFLRIWHTYRPAKKKLHSLRHTFAVNLYTKSDQNLSLVQRALGHASLHTTSVYLQIEHSLDSMRKFIE